MFSGKRKITDRKWKGACLLLLCLSLTVLLFGAIWTAYGYRAEFPELPPGVPAARSFEQAMEATKDMAVPEAAKLLFLDKLLPQPLRLIERALQPRICIYHYYTLLHPIHYNKPQAKLPLLTTPENQNSSL